MSEQTVDKTTLIGNNCGNCIRGSKSITTEECVECNDVENKTGKKFTKWSKKES